MTVTIIKTPSAPPPVGPYSQAVDTGQFVFVSGQLGIDPAAGGLCTSIEDQTRQAMKNLVAVLASAGLTKENIVKTTVFLAVIGDFQVFNRVYEHELADAKPARSVVAVAGLPRDALVEIEAIACR
ncbi:MAG: Rid family detoxifying hydrolase [Chitinispirillaceae bacterium]|jgi:2-iminobutanoate/2-iminopropanoate deaminase|nr:Rid family detoxifying hydrolase [Chitinispirillaceae bacterium]